MPVVIHVVVVIITSSSNARQHILRSFAWIGVWENIVSTTRSVLHSFRCDSRDTTRTDLDKIARKGEDFFFFKCSWAGRNR